MLEVRDDFPILSRDLHGQRLVYLDNAATSQKPQQVIDAITRFYTMSNANILRGVHTLAEEATGYFDDARDIVATTFNVRPKQVVFTAGTTASINFVATSWALDALKPGDEILVSILEHHANLIPWQEAARRTGAKLVHVGLTRGSEIDWEDFRRKLSDRTRIVAVAYVSNVLGTVLPIAEIVELAHARGALVLVDGAQAVGHFPVDVAALGCDFFAFSGHKCLGPTGIGCLIVGKQALASLQPYQFGGGMISKVTRDHAEWAEPPAKFEAGTPNIAGAIGLAAALKYLKSVGIDEIRKHEDVLLRKAWAGLKAIPQVKLYGPPPGEGPRGNVLSFAVDGAHPHDVAHLLNESGVAIRAGHHCAEPLMTELGVVALCRASFALYNTVEDVDALVAGVHQALDVLSGGQAKMTLKKSVPKAVDGTSLEEAVPARSAATKMKCAVKAAKVPDA